MDGAPVELDARCSLIQFLREFGGADNQQILAERIRALGRQRSVVLHVNKGLSMTLKLIVRGKTSRTRRTIVEVDDETLSRLALDCEPTKEDKALIRALCAFRDSAP